MSWPGCAAGYFPTVKVPFYVHYLRRKLGKGIVLTVRGIGYRLGARS